MANANSTRAVYDQIDQLDNITTHFGVLADLSCPADDLNFVDRDALATVLSSLVREQKRISENLTTAMRALG